MRNCGLRFLTHAAIGVSDVSLVSLVGSWFIATEEGYRAIDSLHEDIQIIGDLLTFHGLLVRCSNGAWGEGGREREWWLVTSWTTFS